MTDKEEYLEFWGFTPGTEEAEKAWADKVEMMEGRHMSNFPMIFVRQDVHYESPIDGRVIRSQHDRLDDMARHDCVEYDPEMKKDQTRRIEANDRALEDSIADSVERQFNKWPTAQREKFANELSSGLDVEPVRLTANGG